MSSFLDRRTFVGMSAGVVAASGAVTEALAQQKLGQPHPPLVDEHDPAIRTSVGKIFVGGKTLDAYVAHPANAARNTNSVVLSMHIWGVDTSMRDTARRLAKAGYAAIIPNLFALNAEQPPSGDGATDYRIFSPFAAKLDRAQIDGALAAAAADIKAAFPGGKQAIWGYCMGGAIALNIAVAHPETYSAAAIFYGAVAGVDPKSLKIPMVGSYGAKDDSIPAADVRAFSDALAVPHDIKIYDEAAHAFMDDQRKSYVASAATDAWARTLAFLGKYLASASRINGA